MQLNKVEPDEAHQIMRWVSPNLVWHIGYKVMFFGVRLVASRHDSGGYFSIEYCLGDDQVFILFCTKIVLRIFEFLPENITEHELLRFLPAHSISRKPISLDANWHLLKVLLNDLVNRQRYEASQFLMIYLISDKQNYNWLIKGITKVEINHKKIPQYKIYEDNNLKFILTANHQEVGCAVVQDNDNSWEIEEINTDNNRLDLQAFLIQAIYNNLTSDKFKPLNITNKLLPEEFLLSMGFISQEGVWLKEPGRHEGALFPEFATSN